GPTRGDTTEIGGTLTVEPVGTDTRTSCALLHASRVTGNPLRPRAQGAGQACRASDPEAHPAAPQRQSRRISMHLHDVRRAAVAQLAAAVVLALGGVAPVWAAPRHPTHTTHPTIPAAAAAAEGPPRSSPPRSCCPRQASTDPRSAALWDRSKASPSTNP